MPHTTGPDWLTNSWRTFLREPWPLDPRRSGSEYGNETQERWPSIENGALQSWGSTSSASATIANVTW